MYKGVEVVYNIEFYEDKRGNSEIINYLKELRYKNNKDARIKLIKITSYINQLSEKGLNLGQPYIKHIQDDIWELRTLRDRILFANFYNNNIILLSIFVKKTDKTPKKEIEKAKRLLIDYLKRRE